MAAVIYLCSSRGGVAALLVGIAAAIAFSQDRWSIVGALTAAAVGSAAVIYALHARPQLVNGPFGSEAVLAQGRTMAFIVAAVCLSTALVFAVASHFVTGRITIPRFVGVGVVVLTSLTLVAGVALAHPAKRFEDFKAFPTFAEGDFVNAHITSGSGTGRWQQWTAAVDAWRTAPIRGIGAGGYESFWAQHRPTDQFVRNAHSLYLQTLGELGLVGFLLLTSVFAVLVGAGLILCTRSVGAERQVRAGLLATGLAFLVAAGIDWMWELTVVGIVGVIALTAGLAGRDERHRATWALRAGTAIASALFIGTAAVSLVVHLDLQESERASQEGGSTRHSRRHKRPSGSLPGRRRRSCRSRWFASSVGSSGQHRPRSRPPQQRLRRTGLSGSYAHESRRRPEPPALLQQACTEQQSSTLDPRWLAGRTFAGMIHSPRRAAARNAESVIRASLARAILAAFVGRARTRSVRRDV